MVPAMVTVDQNAEISYNKTAIISASVPNKNVTDSYLQTTSGLVMATTSNPEKLKTKAN